jgi:diguanylate cyclase (GGDEF)-like protein
LLPWEPELKRLQAAYRRIARRLMVRLRRRLLLGIGGRLAIAFAAVAILAVTANLVAERGVRVVQSTRLDRGQYSPIPATGFSRALGAPVAPLTLAAHAGEPPRHADEQLHAEAQAEIRRFLSAVDRFQSASRESSESSRSADDRNASLIELETSTKDFRRLLLARPSLGSDVDATLLAYRQAGAASVQAADARRAATQEYLARLEAVDGRITASISAGWKFFGRVLARQSLLTLHSDIEELRRRFAAVGSPENDSAALPDISASERAVSEALDSSEPGLLKSEGADWVRHTREDLKRMAALREIIGATSSQILDDRQSLAASRARLAAAASTARAAADAAAVGELPKDSGGTSITAVTSAAAARSSPVVAAVTTTTTTADTVPDPGRRIAVGCITGAVLAILSAISIWTVRSIVVPVGRILDATRRLARGDAAVHVPRGGLKELDSLAAAFNRMAGQLETARDITLDYHRHLESQVEQRTRQLQHLAERDPLTLLANRRRFFVLLDQSMQRAREIECGVAVFFIDLDNFKNLNDGMGHGFGDRVLISVAQRLEETAAGFGFAARLGGDEFTVVHEEVVSRHDAHEAGRKLVEAFRRPLAVEGREITVSVSIGASLYPDHEGRAEDLLSAADAALFRAKALGRNQLAMFTRELRETATRKFTTEQGIRRALEHGQFELEFQPEVSLESLEVGLIEALVRWRLPDGRLAAPDEFLAVAEESGLILELGDWVLRNALRAASNWHHGLWPEVKVAINVSARQLIDYRFVQRIQDLLREYALPPACIELELTESVLQTGRSTLESLQLLRSLGIAIALDDFGTGYSSFASLEQLPLSRIKLDRSLIAGIDSNSRAAAVAIALIRLCDELDIEVTAEGVERESQFACLAESRAMYLQGYLISRPVAEAEVLTVNSLMPRIMHDLMLSVPSRPLEGSRPAAQASGRRLRPAAKGSPEALRSVKIPGHE